MTDATSDPGLDRALPKPVFRMLLAAGRRLARDRDPLAATRFLLESALTLVGGQAGALLVDRGEGIRTEVHVDLGDDDRRAVARSLVGRALSTGGTVDSHEALLRPELANAPSVRDLAQRAAVCVPFVGADGSRGALYVERTTRPTPFSAEEKAYLALLADQAALAIDRLRDDGAAAEPAASATPARAGHAAPPVELLGSSRAMTELRARIAQLAGSDLPVLLIGETGSGKELVARALHAQSRRSTGPFVAENCAAIAAELVESELFGHVAGAFTGAVADRIGRFEEAAGGTLFLDEVGDMPLPAQAKVLRALQERRVRRLGSREAIAVDVRIVAATNRDLRALARDGRFREDLYYRLAGAVIAVPPLRARDDDVLLLAERFVAELTHRHGRQLHLDEAGRRRLRSYSWPGNVRELRHALERAFVLCEGEVIDPELLPSADAAPATATTDDGPTTLAQAEADAIRHALEACGGDKSRAARALGISRTALYAKLRRQGG